MSDPTVRCNDLLAKGGTVQSIECPRSTVEQWDGEEFMHDGKKYAINLATGDIRGPLENYEYRVRKRDENGNWKLVDPAQDNQSHFEPSDSHEFRIDNRLSSLVRERRQPDRSLCRTRIVLPFRIPIRFHAIDNRGLIYHSGLPAFVLSGLSRFLAWLSRGWNWLKRDQRLQRDSAEFTASTGLGKAHSTEGGAGGAELSASEASGLVTDQVNLQNAGALPKNDNFKPSE